jgi:pseudouridine-5'-phosphate glycosidase/pseudouridine kinase
MLALHLRARVPLISFASCTKILFTQRKSISSGQKVSQEFEETNCIKISDEVSTALKERKPVVALETTIYTHGFPHPDNVALALSLESIIRRNGGVPATIGIIGGVAKIGMTPDELLMITESAGKPETMKLSRKDLPYILGMVIFK